MTSLEITDGIVQEFLAAHYTKASGDRREVGRRAFSEETLIALAIQVN
jgi:hypothetical protein